MPVITVADLRRFVPHADVHIATAFEDHGDAAFRRWEITTPARLQMFMAHVAVESAWLTKLFENMSYSAERLCQVWPARFPTLASAQPYAHNPQGLANKVYGGRLGNTEPDSGWLCRGTGLLATTGLTNFTALAKHMGQTVDETRARLTSDEGMVDCAAATWHMLGCNAFADRGDMEGCTKRINGGLNGLADRKSALLKAENIWPVMRPLDVPLVAAVAAAVVVRNASAPPVTSPGPLVTTGPHITGVPAAPTRQTWGEWFAATFFRRTA